ncbi:hypothetical protein [Streptomyces tanashiensis]|uniref:hypothetical protein n=1 Tax=Streptomyces tanashiensis TaxID=67367 RepID=UPI003440F711
MSRTAIDTDTNGEQPPPEDDRAFLGHPRGPLASPARRSGSGSRPSAWLRRTMHPVH